MQGSRTRPYRVEIRVERLWGSDWEKLTSALMQRPVFAAKLLAGQMPENIEDVFTDVGLSLFPDRSDDLETDCSCPDWSNPCKHVAAVYLLLGEEFDRDPFLIFKLRGAEREELVGAAAESGIGADDAAIEASDCKGQTDHHPSRFLLISFEFWGQENSEREEGIHGAAGIPTVSAALPKRLGSFPFWRGKESFVPALEEIYRRASPSGLDVFLRER